MSGAGPSGSPRLRKRLGGGGAATPSNSLLRKALDPAMQVLPLTPCSGFFPTFLINEKKDLKKQKEISPFLPIFLCKYKVKSSFATM